MHLIEADLKRFGADITFKRLLGEGFFVCNAFTFYNGVSPYNAYTGRQPACLPDLENADFNASGEHTDAQREQRIREAGIAQATAVAKINRALKTRQPLTVVDSTSQETSSITTGRRPQRTNMVDGTDHTPLSEMNQNAES